MQKYFLVIYSQCCGELKDHIHIYKYLPIWPWKISELHQTKANSYVLPHPCPLPCLWDHQLQSPWKRLKNRNIIRHFHERKLCHVMMTIPQSAPGSIRRKHFFSTWILQTSRVWEKVMFSSEFKAYDTNGVLHMTMPAINYQMCVLFSEMGSMYHFIEKVSLC